MVEKRQPIDFTEFRKPEWMEFVAATIWGAGTINNLSVLRTNCCRKGCTKQRLRSLVVFLTEGKYQNFCCHTFGSALTLWKEHTGLEVYDAAIDLCKEKKCPVPYLGFKAYGG